MFLIPFTEFFRVVRFEENSADTGDVFHTGTISRQIEPISQNVCGRRTVINSPGLSHHSLHLVHCPVTRSSLLVFRFASTFCLLPSQTLRPHQRLARNAPMNEIPVKPRPIQVSNGYDNAPIWSPAR